MSAVCEKVLYMEVYICKMPSFTLKSSVTVANHGRNLNDREKVCSNSKAADISVIKCVRSLI